MSGAWLVGLLCGPLCLLACVGGEQATPSREAVSKDSMVVVLNMERKIKPEFVSAFRASFEKCKTKTVHEPGCLSYGMYQSYTDSTIFFIEEEWKNDGELAKHGQTEHLKVHLAEIKDMGDPNHQGLRRKLFIDPAVNP